MTLTSFMLVFAWLVAAGPAEGPAPRPGSHDIHTPPGRRMSFDESIGASVTTPGVVGYSDAADNKRERDQDIPRITQNPQIQVMPGVRVNAGANNGFELQTTITQGWNVEGYGKSRRQAASADTDVLEADARALALEQQFGAADAWIHLHSAEQRLAMAKADLALAENLVEVLTLARDEGVATRLDVAEAEALAAEVASAVVELGGEVHDLGLALARETGATSHGPLGTQGPYPDPVLPDEAELRTLFASVDQLPAVQRHRLRARAALAEARAMHRTNGTVVQTGASAQLESSGELVLFGVLGAKIPAGNRNQRGQASAQALARQAEADADQLIVELSAVLGIALHELRHTRERVELLRDRTLPALDDLIEARTTALELGEGTQALVLAAHHRRSVVARELAIAEADNVLARVEVWLYLQAIESEDDPR